MTSKCTAPVLMRVVIPVFVGDRIELPGHHTNGRAAQVGRGFLGWRERKEETLLAFTQELPIERIDFSGRLHHVNPPKAFEYRTVGLEHEVVTVFRTAEALADRTVVYVRIKNKIHGIPR